ncbi:hypothetical protein [Spartinivicinus poritis]|uniref:Uncharacterized protein n=1 Tax=Spartinivicinus poritis TaxID=2994640 RepID=A0ABT5U4G0_9GAMM|nr:hypothetical protein [Spartinivicinus sp. A2-2]MDE1461207.1 hypothetical protein [Spartinivicinus sp. A2-2]
MKKTLLTVLIIASSNSIAVPTFKSCDISINSPELGVGVLFDESCQQAYVLPPALGQATIVSTAPNANIGFCQSLQNKQETNRIISDYITDQDKKIKRNQKILQSIESRTIPSLEKKLTPLNLQSEIITSKIKSIEETRTETLKRVVTTKKKYLTCKQSSTNHEVDCKQELNIFKKERSKLVDIRHKIDTLTIKHYDNALQIKTINRQIDAEKNKAEKIKLSLHKDIDELNSLQNNIVDSYNDFAFLEGMTVGFNYNLPWQHLISEYKQLNPGIRFQAMPIKDVNFIFRNLESGVLTNEKQLPMTLSAGIPDKSTGLSVQPSIPLPPKKLSEQTINNISFYDLFAAQARFNLIGACPLVNSQGDFEEAVVKSLHNYLLPNAIFEYEVKVNYSYTSRESFLGSIIQHHVYNPLL